MSNKEIEDIADIDLTAAVMPHAKVKSSTITASSRGEFNITTKNPHTKAGGNSDAVLESFMIEADKTKISQVLSNLLRNAQSSIKLKAGSEEGRITVTVNRIEEGKGKSKFRAANTSHDPSSTSQRNDEIIVSITDNGQGIPSDVAQNLFTKFVSGSDSGTGLGLYISKNIIEVHGGRIWAKNNDVEASSDGTAPITSSGATFSFSLPVLEHITKS